jgi:chromosome condensin MukBEF ATPase and DNA-binding subunit MukB
MTELTIKELQGFIDYFELLKGAGEKDLLPVRIARQLLATMQRLIELEAAYTVCFNGRVQLLSEAAQREEKLKEMVSKRDRELTCNRENVKRLKAKIKQLEGRKLHSVRGEYRGTEGK